MRGIAIASGFLVAGCATSVPPTMVVPAHPVAHSVSPIPGACQENAAANADRIGCYLNAAHRVGRLPALVYWHIDEFSAVEAAAASRTAAGAVVSAQGRVFLQTINGDPHWRPRSGNRLARVGPFPAAQGVDLIARFMEARLPPGMITRPHTHSGVEAWYMLGGSQCLETPTGSKVVPAGRSIWVPEGPPMQLSSAGHASLVLVLHPASKPWMSMTQWKPKGLCSAK